jgi:hypothetical protein
MNSLSPDQSAKLDDHIVRKEILKGIHFLKDALGVNLAQALEQFSQRYRELRESKNDQFTVSHEEYWKDFYS